MTRLVTIDPGMSSGIAEATFGDDQPVQDFHRYQVRGGLIGFSEFVDQLLLRTPDTVVVCEKFTPRPGDRPGGFTLKTVEPLRIEGFLVGSGLIEDYEKSSKVWRQPASQYFTGGSSLADKKKRAREWLKQHGLYLTGKDVGQPDADDAISATLHLIGYLRDTKHIPTLQKYFA